MSKFVDPRVADVALDVLVAHLGRTATHFDHQPGVYRSNVPRKLTHNLLCFLQVEFLRKPRCTLAVPGLYLELQAYYELIKLYDHFYICLTRHSIELS